MKVVLFFFVWWDFFIFFQFIFLFIKKKNTFYIKWGDYNKSILGLSTLDLKWNRKLYDHLFLFGIPKDVIGSIVMPYLFTDQELGMMKPKDKLIEKFNSSDSWLIFGLQV